MDIILGFVAWYKTVIDKFFSGIGFNAETTEGIMVIAIGAIVLNLAGIFFAKMADKFNEK